MKTLDQILEAVKSGKESNCIDRRDFSRLSTFFPDSEWEAFGFALKEGCTHEPEPYTEQEVLERLKGDLDFAFQKALGKRGISAGLMFDVIRMWMWVLDDDLQYWSASNYAQYGLPLLKAVAIKYGLENQIGDDRGDEYIYSSECG